LDSESWTYGYSFSDEILREWEWSEHFAAQPETLRYCEFVADRLDLRRDIEFGCRIAAAAYDEAAGEWEVEAEDGRRARGRFLITAIGPLSAPPCRPSRASRASAARRTTPACGRTSRWSSPTSASR
jgi:cation diffusion facilitator CzcD-associated flavoprotein CzcO